jgi:hypothetical protein
MVCDYVIITYLYIECISNIKINEIINILYKYYDWEPSDTEDPDFDNEWNEYINYILSPVNKEIIYENRVWINDEYIMKIPDYICCDDIIRVTKIEKRKSAFDFYNTLE